MLRSILIDVASTPPLRGGEYSSQTKTPDHSLRDNFKPRQSPAFVLDHINVAFGIHSGTNCIEDLTVEEKPVAVTESPEKLPCLTIEDINFPLVLIHDAHKPLIRVTRKFDRDGRGALTNFLYQSVRGEGPPQCHAIFSQVLILRRGRFPRDTDVLLEITHLIEHLYAVHMPITHINHPVIAQPEAVQNVFGLLFGFCTMQLPLAQEFSFFIQHSDPMVTAPMTVANVNIAVQGIDIDS